MQLPTEGPESSTTRRRSYRDFLIYLGPALMVSIAYMDPGNFGTDLQAGATFKFGLVWAVWLASAMAMLLQYLSGKLGIASGYSLAELVKRSLGRRSLIIPYWLGAELAAAATDLAEYLGTVIALNLLFGIPLLYAAIFGAFDVLLIMTLTTRKFRIIEQFFLLLTSVLVVGFLYQLLIIKPSLEQVAYHSVIPGSLSTPSMLLVVGIIGATVMPHALFVHSWLSKNKMDLTGRAIPDAKNRYDSSSASIEVKQRTRKVHLWETALFLTIAAVVNVGILLVSTPLNASTNTIGQAIQQLDRLFAPIVGIVFLLTLLASGLLSSTLGTLSGQVIMEDLIGKHWNIWARRIVTRCINVFPTTIAVLLGLDPLRLLIYSQVILSIMIPLPMIPLVYYTSKRKFMGELVNRRSTIILAVTTVALILAFNAYLILTSL
ncbi:MAG: Nramp family divalent metal transporter [Nitrososphaerales archaeon]